MRNQPGHFIRPVFFALLLPITMTFAQADESLPNSSVLTFKGGAFNMQDDRQSVGNGEIWNFGDASEGFGVEWEKWIDSEKNVTLGGEYMHFSADYTREGDLYSNRMDANMLTFRAKRFAGTGSDALRPYFGGGIGIANAFDGSGGLESDSSGLALQGFFGIQARSKRVGFRLELAYVLASVDDNRGHDVDLSGLRLFGGLSFFFGRAP